MICGDAEVTIGSTLAACAVPNVSKYVTNIVLVPNNAPLTVKMGASLHRPTKNTQICFYDTLDNISEQINELSTARYHITSYLQTIQDDIILDLPSAVHQITSNLDLKRLNGLTIMLDDRNGLGKVGPRYLGYLDLMESEHGEHFFKHALGPIASKTTVLVAGSWYDAFGHQGGYVTGDASTVESLTWNAKAFFFSTPPMPLQAAMSDKALELLSSCSGSRMERTTTPSLCQSSSLSGASSPSTPQNNNGDPLRHTNIVSLLQDIECYADESLKSPVVRNQFIDL